MGHNVNVGHLRVLEVGLNTEGDKQSYIPEWRCRSPRMISYKGARISLNDFPDKPIMLKVLAKRMLRLLSPSMRTRCSLVSPTFGYRTRG